MAPSRESYRSIEELPALRALPARVARRVAAAAVSRRYARGAVLFRSGDTPAGLHFVLSGRVRVARQVARGASVLHFEEAGGVLGEIPAFGGGAYPATATAVEAVRCAVLGADAVERLLGEEPDFARFALRRIARRARVVLERLDELSAYTVTARVAAYLRTRVGDDESSALDLGMSQASLAEQLGTVREVLVRALRALCDAGAIRRVGRSRFTIVDAQRLRDLARGKGEAVKR